MPATPDAFLPVIGTATANVIEMLHIFLKQDDTLFISGPTGSGKSRLARWCHQQSPRRQHPFETLDLLSVPEQLQMAELVGWERGAFTGATHNVPGALTRAAQGTLFIDEIDKLSLTAQAGLLRILEERRFRALGASTGDRQVRARFIVGTNADLQTSVRAGRFREDLFYRINVLPIQLPSLAERIDEIPAWAAFMLARCGDGKQASWLSDGARDALCLHPWPGNLRQLDNVVRRAYAFALAERGRHENAERGRHESRLTHDDEVLLDKRHVERALTFEQRSDGTLATQLWNMAQALAREAVRREHTTAKPLTLKMMDGFRGMVLGATVQLLDSREQAFRLFEREHLLTGRNHHRALKRELERAQQLVHALGLEPLAPDLKALIETSGCQPA